MPEIAAGHVLGKIVLRIRQVVIEDHREETPIGASGFVGSAILHEALSR